MSFQAWKAPSEWEKQKFRFITAFGNSQWIVRGEPSKSRFVKEMEWKSRMFGAFTTKEKLTIERWIETLQPPQQKFVNDQRMKDHYLEMVRRVPQRPCQGVQPLHFSAVLESTLPKIVDFHTALLTKPLTQPEIAILLLLSLIPFQQSLARPVKAATDEEMTALRILRVLNGFSARVDNTVDGTDETHSPSRRGIGEHAMQLLSLAGVSEPMLQSLISKEPVLHQLECIASDPKSNFWFLIGVQYGFIINIITNRSVLLASGIMDEMASSLKDIGLAALNEIASLYVDDRWECQQGFSFISSYLHECSFESKFLYSCPQ